MNLEDEAKKRLDELCRWLEQQGWTVNVSEGAVGYLIEFAKTGVPVQTVSAPNAMETLKQMFRQLGQIGLIPEPIIAAMRQLENAERDRGYLDVLDVEQSDVNL